MTRISPVAPLSTYRSSPRRAVPALRCTASQAFGGSDGRTLFISSARDEVGREALEATPLSWRLFTLRTECGAWG